MTIRVLLIGPYPANTAGSLRYRWEQYIPDFEKADIQLVIKGFQSLASFKPGRKRKPYQQIGVVLKGLWHHWQVIKGADQFDVVVIQREAMPFGMPIFERWLSRKGIKFVYDYDDAMYAKYTSYESPFQRLMMWPSKTKEIIKLSSLVIAGNPTLVNYAKQYNDNVVLIPTVPDPTVYQVPDKKEANPNPVTIGWSGSRANTESLDAIIDPLKRLAQQFQLRVRVAGDSRFKIEGVDASGNDWEFPMDDSQVTQALAEYDIGLMPLQDTLWNRGKCGFKALLYMSMGIPPIVSPVGVNTDIVQDGYNGLVADTPEEWYQALAKLLGDPNLRQQLGKNARLSVEQKWSALRESARLIEIIRQQASR